jgi:uncharacterized protein (DUF58 family)
MPEPVLTSAIPGARFIDPQALMAIRNLELRARVVVEGFWSGIHRSPYHGFSVEFTEYRQYSPDDDPRYLDWRVYARSDRYFIKKFEDETNLRCFFLTDMSRSMDYGSTGYTKAQYAATLTATLAYFLHLQGDAVGLMTFDEDIREYLPARHRRGHLRQLMLALEKPAGGARTLLRTPLRRIAEIIRRRGLVVLLSDFLSPLAEFEAELAALSAIGHELLAFQVLDPAEVDFNFSEPAMFEDAESRRGLYVDPVAARKQYVTKFQEHQSGLKRACDRFGAAYQVLNTTRPLELALFDFLRTRMQRVRKVRRAGLAAGGRRH